MGQAKNRGTFAQRQAQALEKKAKRLEFLRGQFEEFQRGMTAEQLEQSTLIRGAIARSLGVEPYACGGLVSEREITV